MKPCKSWATFIRIPSPSTSDSVMTLDPTWCAARGIHPGAEVVLRLLRDHVLHMVRYLEEKRGLVSYHFLVHDRDSGVPTKEPGAYIHLRLEFKRPVVLHIGNTRTSHFEMTMPLPDAHKQASVGGIDMTMIVGGVPAANRLIDLQSQWVLALVEAHHRWSDDGAMVRQVQQFLHFYSNMLQMVAR